MPSIDLTFQHHPCFLLKGITDLRHGWRPWIGGHGFFGRGQVEAQGDRTLSLNARLKVWPSYRAYLASEYPEDLEGSGHTPLIYGIRNGTLAIWIPLGSLLSDPPGPDRLTHSFPSVLVKERSGLRFELKVEMILNPPPLRRPGNIRERNTQFCQGGLPSLGRRHR